MLRPTALVVAGALATAVSALGLNAPANATAPAAAPLLSSPAAGAAVSSNPVLTWNSVSGAKQYHVQVAGPAGFTSPVYDQSTVGTSIAPPNDLPTGALSWRVAATDGGSGQGPWSAARSFTKNPKAGPTLLGPDDGAQLQYPQSPPVLSWSSVPGTDHYVVQVGTDPGLIGATSYTTQTTSLTITQPQTSAQPYYWNVTAVSAANVSSQPSQTRSYQITWSDVPQLVSPANAVTPNVTDVDFQWQALAGAASYELQVNPNQDFTNNMTIDVTVKGTAYSPPTTIDNGGYFWRVRGIDVNGNLGGWSAVWQFSRGWVEPTNAALLERPTLSSPAWDSGNPSSIPHVQPGFAFDWSPVHHAAFYELNVGTDVNFSPGTYSVCYTNHTSFVPYGAQTASGMPGSCNISAFSTGVVYYWRVRGIDAPHPINGASGTPGVLGNWSDTGSSDTFRFLVDPTMPAPTAPDNGATVGTPVLQWTSVQGAQKYKVTIVNATSSVVVNAVATYATSYVPTTALKATDGPFSWYVQAVDANGDTSAAPARPDWWTFSLITPTSDTTFALLSPSYNSSSVRMPLFSWQPYSNAAKYQVYLVSNGFQQQIGTNLPYAAFASLSAPVSPGAYSWYVEADGSNGAVLAFSAYGQITITAVDVLGNGDYLTPARCQLPSNCTPVTDTPTLSWNAAPDAAYYIVTLANDAQFTNVQRVYTTAFTSLTPRESLPDNQAGQAYYWFVRPCVDSTHCGPGPDDNTANVNASAFQKRSLPITLVSPAPSSSVADQVSFAWQDYLDTYSSAYGNAAAQAQEAKQYTIQVSSAADFSTLLDSATVDQTTYTPYSKAYPEGPLYWRVQAVDGSGNALTWSTSSLVTKASSPTTLAAPAANAPVTGAPALQWNPQNYAAQYTVEVYANGDLNYSAANRKISASAKFTAYAPTSGLPSGTYAWRVRGVNASGNPLPWSAGRLFTLNADAPTLLTPANGSLTNSLSPLFTWNPVSGASSYRWQTSSTNAFTSTQASQTTVMTAWAPLSALPDGQHWWRVQVLDASNNVIATSAAWSFTTDTKSPTVTSKAPTSSASISGPFTVTFSEPVKNLSATSFRLVTAGTTTTLAGTVSATSTSATFRPSAALIPGQTYSAQLTSAITDTAGNPLVPYSWTVRTSITVENNSPAVHEQWDRDTSSAASGGSYDASMKAGTSASLTFTGTNVAVLGMRAKTGGYADVYLDGVRKGTVSFYNSATQNQYAVWSTSGLTNARHTVQLRPLGTKPAAATGAWTYLDAFKVGSVLYQESNGAVVEHLTTASNTAASGGSYDYGIHVTSGDNGSRPAFSVRFAGTGVAYYGVKSPIYGTAAIYLDGTYRATVNANSSTTQYKALLYRSPTLTNGVHTITISLLGTSTGAKSQTALDYLSIS